MGSKREVIILAIVAALMVIAVNHDFGFIGSFAYQPNNYTWDFSNISSYIFNSSEINFTGSTASLSRISLFYQWQTTTDNIASIVTAIRDEDHNDTSKVNTLNNQTSNVGDDKRLYMKFNTSLNNSDVISFYLHNTPKRVTVYLCTAGADCNISGHNGFFTTTSTGDVSASITISNLSSQTNEFDIKVNDTTKIDYITAAYSVTTINNATNYTYMNSTIETNDYTIDGLYSFGLLSVDSDLKGQSISYSYSIDSGLEWNEISGFNLSYANISGGKIRFLAALYSNTSEAPVIDGISLVYYAYCNENWTCTDWTTCSNNSRTRSCSELNGCIAPENRPSESDECGDFTRMVSNDDLEITLITNGNTSSIPLGITTDNSSNTSNISLINIKSFNIDLNQTISNTLVNATFRYNYNETLLDSLNINISTLSIYYYNSTSGLWEGINTTINTSSKQITANVDHFSKYGIFGDEMESDEESQGSSSSSSSGGGGGGGSSKKSSSTSQETAPPEIEKQAQNEENQEEGSKIPVEKQAGFLENALDEENQGPITGKASSVENIKPTLPSISIIAIIMITIIVYVAHRLKNKKIFKDREKTNSK